MLENRKHMYALLEQYEKKSMHVIHLQTWRIKLEIGPTAKRVRAKKQNATSTCGGRGDLETAPGRWRAASSSVLSLLGSFQMTAPAAPESRAFLFRYV